MRLYPRYPPNSGGGGGGVSWQTYAYGDRTTQDLKTLLSSVSATGDSGEFVEMTVASGVTASTVGTMAYIEWALVDVFGELATAGISSGDLVRAVVQWYDVWMPENLRLGVSLTAGTFATATRGVAAGVQHNAADDNLYAWESRLATTWATINTAPAADPLTRGVVLAATRDEATNRARISATPFDTDGEESAVGGGTTSVPSTNADADGEYTHIQLLVGTVGSIGAAYVAKVAVKSLCSALKDTARFSRKAAPTVVPRLPSAGAYRILTVGHSYALAFNAPSALSGAATSTGLTNSWTIRDGGTTITTWPVSTVGTPNVGYVGYLLDRLDAWVGNTGGVLVRRGQSGDALGNTSETYFPMLGAGTLGDCTATGITAFDLVILYAGTNDANDAGDTGRYPDRLRKWIRAVRDHSPHAIIIIPTEEPDVGSFPLIATIEAAKATVAAEFEHVYHLTSVAGYGQLDTSGHPSDAGHATIAEEIEAVLLGLA